MLLATETWMFIFLVIRILEPLHVHIAFRWLPFPIGQACSQVYLTVNFGCFELRMFPWSPSEVEEGIFYPFTLKVAYNCT